MELTPEIIANAERLIAERVSIYRGRPYNVRWRQPGTSIEVTGTIAGTRIANNYALAPIDTIRLVDESTFVGMVNHAASALERQLATYLRENPAPAPRNTDYRIDLDPLLNYRDWGTYSNVISMADNAITQAVIGQRVTATLPPITKVEPEPVRVSTWQRLASGESVV